MIIFEQLTESERQHCLTNAIKEREKYINILNDLTVSSFSAFINKSQNKNLNEKFKNLWISSVAEGILLTLFAQEIHKLINKNNNSIN